MTDLIDKIAHLPPEKRALLELLLQEEGVDLSHQMIIPQKRTTNVFPLSYSQQRLWILDQIEPNSPLYNIPTAMRITGELDINILTRSFNEIIKRHEILRTTFQSQDGEPVQVIHPEIEITIPIIDLQSIPPEKREATALQEARKVARQPFNLSTGPLIKVHLYRLDHQHHIIMLNIHHIIADGWSIGILLQELAALYNSLSEGKPSGLPDLPLQYADYAAWQRKWLRGARLEKQLAYWQKQLGGDLPVLQLPTDYPRPAVQSSKGGSLTFKLAATELVALKRLSQQEDATLFMTLLAAFLTVLYRYTNQEDICVGTPIANRKRAELEGMIGFFVNTLVLRTDLSQEPSFRQLVQRVRDVTLGAYENQDIPFEMLVDRLQPEREMSYSPFFQVMFAFQNAPVASLKLRDVTLAPLEVHSGTAKFDLTMTLGEENGQLYGALEYNSDLFSAETMERFLKHFRTLLNGVLAEPDQSIATIPMLSPAEQEQLIFAWNDTAGDYPRDRCLHHIFAEQAQKHPDVLAVHYLGHQYTYSELDSRANQLAHHLQKLGVGPEVMVGIFMERSLDLIVAILGVLKAGGAYVPLDTNYPPKRLEHIANDTQLPMLLTQQRLRDQIPGKSATGNKRKIIYLDTDWEEIAQNSAREPTSKVTSQNLAYVLYTSGSTGVPKGVCCQHAGVVNLLTDFEEREPLAVGERCSWWTSLNFDVSVYEIFSPLLVGGALYIVPDDVRVDSEKFISWLHNQGIHSAYIPPFMLGEFQAWLENQAETPVLHRLLVGVEPINELLLAAINRKIPELHIINGYGPTEATICCTLFSVQPENAQNRNTPIGKPTKNTQIYLLDSHLQPVPVGVPGELYIGGEGLARGYLNQPDLTAERFIPNPLTPHISPRLYKTGDQARYLPDGNIEFIGRTDFQVKLHGFRIELGEIEAVLSQHPEVMKSVVIVWEGIDPGETSNQEQQQVLKRLVAYVVPAKKSALTPAELRQFVANRLPDYMVPSAFVLLNALPLTPHGKVDRRALPAPDISRADLENAYAPPRNPDEERLVSIWKELFNLDQIGIHDNFFELGGHSLLATQLISRLRQVFEVELILREFFNAPTIAGLAKMIERARHTPQHIQLPTITPQTQTGPAPLSYSQQRLWFLHQLDPNDASYNIPLAVRLTGKLDYEALSASLNAIVRRHAVLRTTFPAENGKPVQHIVAELTVPISRVDLTEISEGEREITANSQVIAAAREPFNLSTGPLLRVKLFKLAANEHIFLLITHHIISDGWSMGIFIQEMAALYQAFSAGEPTPLPELELQYVDFARWQRQWLKDEALAAQLDYWKEQLAGQPPILELPYDHPRPAVQTAKGGHRIFTIPQSVSQRLKALGQQEEATLFMTLLAAFQALLARYSRQEDISVGTPIANRNRAEIENLIGLFVNTLVLRTDLSGNPSFREALRRVREVALGAYSHQDLPFEMLVDALQPDRNLSHTPLFQVMFILQNASEEIITLPDLTLSTMDIETGLSPFDLTMALNETAEGLSGAIEYNSDLFEAATIERLIRHFLTLLSGIVENPDQPIAALPLMTTEEMNQLLVTWNNTQAEFPRDLCVHQLFEAQAARTPEAVAAVLPATASHPRQVITYQELNRRSNQLANYLRRNGVGPEEIVGLYLERSIEMLAGLLGVLKAGGAYLPLDPAYPQERLNLMLSDAQVQIVVTQERFAGRLAQGQLQVICLDAKDDPLAPEPDENLTPLASAENIAYVIYTSGSTGTPKGVLVPHRSVVNHNLALAKEFELKPSDHVLQFATLNFDAAVEEIFPTWSVGATLVLRPGETLLTGEELNSLIAAENLTVLDLPTAYWHEWVNELALLKTPIPASLRLVILGGEKAAAQSLAYWLRMSPGVTLLNTYGPTEGTIVDTVYALGPNIREWDPHEEIPIGRPIANVQVYVLDARLQPVPVGIPGELHIGGQAVARGYLNRPDLTAERFIPNPFSSDAGERLYKTGDLVRYRPDGNIEFLGRVDKQIKLRGYRIELGEIETQLQQHPEIEEAVLVAHSDTSIDKRLVAYVVTKNQDLDLRTYLAQKLPEYMVPSAFVYLDRLPLTPSGKVDRRALPKPEFDRAGIKSEYTPPQSAKEQLLLETWQQALGFKEEAGKPAIGVHDNFFELGGDSILSIQVIALAKQKGLSLTPRQFFEHPTIAGQALVATKGITYQAEQGMVVGEVLLTPIQHWFFEQEFTQPHHWNQALLFEVTAPMNRTLLEQAVAHLLAHHDALRLRFERTPDGWQAFCATLESEKTFVWLDLSKTPPGDERPVIEDHAAQLQASLNLTKGPLFRVAYFDLGPSRSDRLMIIVHHLAMDGVSWRILLEDFIIAYQQLSEGASVRLPPKTTSFQYWAERLSKYAREAQVIAELSHWRGIRQVETGSLPRDHPNGENMISSLDDIMVELNTAETDALLHQVPAAYHTEISDVLLTALAQTLTQWLRTETILIELEGHGREPLFEDVDLSRTVGWFTTIYPVVLELEADEHPGEALKAIKEQLRKIPGNGIGYGLLRYLHQDPDISQELKALPQPEVSFNYLGQFDLSIPAGESISLASEARGPDRSPLGARRLVLEIVAGITHGRLQVQWTYSQNLHAKSTIVDLANDYIRALRTLIDHCLNPDAGGYTPSDFGLAKLDQHKLDKVLSTLTKSRAGD